MNNKQKTILAAAGKVLLTLAAAAGIFLAGTLISLLLMSEQIHLSLTYIAGYLPLALLLPLIWLKQRKQYVKFWLIGTALCVIAAGVNFGMVQQDAAIRIHTSSQEYIYEVTAEDAFVFITHKDNPVDNLTTEQIQAIYSGTLTNWKDVGGEDKTIKAYQCQQGTVNQTMMEHFMAEIPLMEAPTEMGYGYLYAWEEQVSEYRNKPDSIGFCFTSYLTDAQDVKLLCVDGIAPTKENIQNGSYCLVAPDFAVAY